MTAIYLNGATIMTTPTPRQLEIARAAGFAGIEARAERLLADAGEVAATTDAVRAAGEVWSLNGVRIGLDQAGALERATLEADLAIRLEVCIAIRAAYLLIVPPRVPGLREDQAMDGLRAGLVVARDAAARRGVGVAFEFLGFADCPVATPAAAAAVVEGIDDVELVVDSCHWHASGSGPLDELPIGRLAMVHLNDAPPKPPREIEDADRVLPGEGVIRLPQLAATLRNGGYAGPWSLETFNPDYWDQPPDEVARRGASSLEALLGAG
jgi:sugar phosphate isomerase/epimerase